MTLHFILFFSGEAQQLSSGSQNVSRYEINNLMKGYWFLLEFCLPWYETHLMTLYLCNRNYILWLYKYGYIPVACHSEKDIHRFNTYISAIIMQNIQ